MKRLGLTLSYILPILGGLVLVIKYDLATFIAVFAIAVGTMLFSESKR
jgi:hypothetical protein